MSEEEVKSLLDKANDALEAKNFHKTIEITSEAIKLDPKNPMCYLIRFLAEHKVTDIDQLENKVINFDSESYKNLKLYTNKKLFNELEASLKKGEYSNQPKSLEYSNVSKYFDYSNILNKVKSFFEPIKSDYNFPLGSKILMFLSYAPSLALLILASIGSRSLEKQNFYIYVFMLFVHCFAFFINYKLILTGRFTNIMKWSRDDTSSIEQHDFFQQITTNLFVYVLCSGLATFLFFITLACLIGNMYIFALGLYAIDIVVLFVVSKEVVPILYKSFKDCFNL